MVHCEKSLAHQRPIAYVVHRSNAALGRAVCFLGRFLPKLWRRHKRRHFFAREGAQPRPSAGAKAAKPAMKHVIARCTVENPESRSIRLSSI